MNETGLISVIVPIYKVEEYLNDAVESLVRQTYSNMEIILVDDGSPDECGKMCDEWAKRDGRICVIHQKNKGLSAARNVGIEASRGEYLVFMDSDDYVEPTYVEKLYREAVRKQADMVICGVIYLNMDGSCSTQKVTVQDKVLDGVPAMLLLEQGGVIQEAYTVVWNKIYRKNIWETLRFPEGKVYEDAFVMPEVFYSCKKVALINECLYVYRKREGSITAQKKEKYAPVYLEMMEQREKFYEKVGIKELIIQHQVHMYGTYDYFQMQTKETRKRIQKKLRRSYFGQRYATKLLFARRLKNLVAVISLPLYHRLVALLQ